MDWTVGEVNRVTQYRNIKTKAPILQPQRYDHADDLKRFVLACAPAQIQPPVVEQERGIVGCSLVRQLRHELRTVVFSRKVLQMETQDDVAHELAVLPRAVENRGSGFRRGFHFNKTGAPQAVGRSFRILVEPGLVEARKERGKFRSSGQRVRTVAQ